MFFGSSCVYPKNYDIPIKEENLLEGPLEETNEGYALAKICGIKLCNYLSESFHRNYFSVMPTNLYGANDNFDPNSSHVIPGLLKKFHHATGICFRHCSGAVAGKFPAVILRVIDL